MTARTYTYYAADGSEVHGPIVDCQLWQWEREMPGIRPKHIKGCGLPYLYGYQGKQRVQVVRVVAFKNHKPSLHKCGARCMNSTGPNCECSCGGKNHGAMAA